MKDYEYVYGAIKLQVVYLNARAAAFLSRPLSSSAYLLQHTQTPTPEALNFIKPRETPFRPKTVLRNNPPAAL